MKRSLPFVTLRLAMRDHYRRKMAAIHEMDLDDPNVERVDVDKGEKEFMSLLQTIVQNIEVVHVMPEEIVIKQGDPIKTYDHEYIDEKAKFYLILNGDFKVSTLKFGKQKHKKKDGPKEQKPANSNVPAFKKLLGPGDYFGEVAFLFDCNRTSTIKAKLYSTLGALNHGQINSLMNDYGLFKTQLKNEVVRVYDDDLKLFLMHALRRVDYLSNLKDEILC